MKRVSLLEVLGRLTSVTSWSAVAVVSVVEVRDIDRQSVHRG